MNLALLQFETSYLDYDAGFWRKQTAMFFLLTLHQEGMPDGIVSGNPEFNLIATK